MAIAKSWNLPTGLTCNVDPSTRFASDFTPPESTPIYKSLFCDFFTNEDSTLKHMTFHGQISFAWVDETSRLVNRLPLTLHQP